MSRFAIVFLFPVFLFAKTNIDSKKILEHPVLTSEYYSSIKKIYNHGNIDNVFQSNSNLGICYGEDTTWDEYPFIVEMRGGSPAQCICSGSIIDLGERHIIPANNRPATILTAAHCERCAEEIYVGCNNPNSCNDETNAIAYKVNVSSFLTWNYENPTQFSNDIGIFQLDLTAENNYGVIENPPNAKAIRLNNNITENMDVNRVTGYGIDASRSLPLSLQTGTTQYVSNSDCQLALDEYDVTIESNMMCVQDTVDMNYPVTTCSGDSGGPWSGISANNELTQYGVTSFGLSALILGCDGYECKCCPHYPQVASNVGYFVGCICDVIGIENNEGCQIPDLPVCPYSS